MLSSSRGGRYGNNGNEQETVEDGSIACAFVIRQACGLGLGTSWSGSYKEEETKKILNGPDHVRVVAMTPGWISGRTTIRKIH